MSLGAAVRDEIRRHIEKQKSRPHQNHPSGSSKLEEPKPEPRRTGRRRMPVISRKDTIVTPAFTAAGRICPSQFQIASKFGQLTVRLADIQPVERPPATRRDRDRKNRKGRWRARTSPVAANQHRRRINAATGYHQGRRTDLDDALGRRNTVQGPTATATNTVGTPAANSVRGAFRPGRLERQGVQNWFGPQFHRQGSGILYLAIGIHAGVGQHVSRRDTTSGFASSGSNSRWQVLLNRKKRNSHASWGFDFYRDIIKCGLVVGVPWLVSGVYGLFRRAKAGSRLRQRQSRNQSGRDRDEEARRQREEEIKKKPSDDKKKTPAKKTKPNGPKDEIDSAKRPPILPGRRTKKAEATKDAKADDKEIGQEHRNQARRKTQGSQSDVEPEKKRRVIDPDMIRLHLGDGSVIGGKLASRLLKSTPNSAAFNSRAKGPQFHARSGKQSRYGQEVDDHIESLGGADFKAREEAQRSCWRWACRSRRVAAPRGRRQRRTRATRPRDPRPSSTKSPRTSEEADARPGRPGFAATRLRPTSSLSSARSFSKAFTMESKYGTLSAVGDIAAARREPHRGSGKSAASSRRGPVHRPDPVQGLEDPRPAAAIKFNDHRRRQDRDVALGQHLHHWSRRRSNYGTGSVGGQSFPGGTLVGKIGNSGKVFKVGTKVGLIADGDGMLHVRRRRAQLLRPPRLLVPRPVRPENPRRSDRATSNPPFSGRRNFGHLPKVCHAHGLEWA